jgi:hypothetical protein
MTSASCCSSMVSPSANATAAGHRRYWAVAVLALALLHDPASAQQPFVNQGGCPSGYYTSGSFCGPPNKDSRPAVPKPPGASCPFGWYQSGAACVRFNR